MLSWRRGNEKKSWRRNWCRVRGRREFRGQGRVMRVGEKMKGRRRWLGLVYIRIRWMGVGWLGVFDFCFFLVAVLAFVYFFFFFFIIFDFCIRKSPFALKRFR